MEEQGVPASPSADVPLALPGATWSDWRWLVLLLVLVAGMRGWQLLHTEVASRDSIAYIHQAWRLDNESWLHVIPTSEHHPGYPLAVYLMAKPIGRFLPDNRPQAMQLSAQIVSCLASLLLIFPMFYIGRELFDARVGFWGALLYQCLPGPGRVMADGLSDPLFLLLAATATWLMLIALRKGKPGWFALVGLTSALAYLTRTEGALIAMVTAGVLVGLQTTQRWRRDWRTVLWNQSALLGTAAALALPFMLLIGGISLKPGGKGVLPGFGALHREQTSLVASPLPLAMWKFGDGIRPEDRYGWAAWAIVVELDRGFFYALGAPALLGLILFRRRFVQMPGALVMLGCGGALSVLLYRVGVLHGYVGERHVLLIILGGVYFAVAALIVMGGWLARGLSRWRPGLKAASVSLALLILVVIVPLPHTLARLHANRSAYKLAGQWLAAHSRAEDRVMDPFGWVWYHAGRAFLPEPQASTVLYVVLEESKNTHPHLRYKLDEAKNMVDTYHGKVVQSFSLGKGKKAGWVKVYRMRLRPEGTVHSTPAIARPSGSSANGRF